MSTCPLCGGSSRRAFVVLDHPIDECERCRHRFLAEEADPDALLAEVYGDVYFTGGGAGYDDYLDEGEMLRSHGRWYARRVGRHGAPGRMLDVGAAAGFLLQGFVDGGWAGQGLEPNGTMAAHARAALGLDVEVGCLERLEVEEAYDLITMIQVVPHFFDLRRALGRAAAATRVGGCWLIETWRRDSWAARFFGKRWHEYNPPSVRHWFTRRGLDTLAADYGFQPLERGRPPKKIQGRHAQSLLRHQLRQMPAGHLLQHLARLIPARLDLPYPGDDVFWVLYRKVAG